jgi:membrane protein DedA with SNARE-associated domain
MLSALSMVGTALTPVLASDHPLLLAGMSPRSLNLVLAGAQSPFVAFLLVGVLRLVAADPWHFLLGRHGGDQLMAWTRRSSPRAARALVRAHRLVVRVGPAAVFVRPCGVVLVAAGAGGLSPRRVVAADVAGTAAYLTLIFFLGRAVDSPMETILELTSPRVVVTVMTTMGLGVIAWMCHRVRSRRGMVAPVLVSEP